VDLVAVLLHRALDRRRCCLLLDDWRRSGCNRLRSLGQLRQLDEAMSTAETRLTPAVAAARPVRRPGAAAIGIGARWAGDSAPARGDLVAVGTARPLFGAGESRNRLAGGDLHDPGRIPVAGGSALAFRTRSVSGLPPGTHRHPVDARRQSASGARRNCARAPLATATR